MDHVSPSQFYTGIVSQVYAPLRSSVPDAKPYAGFIRACGEPALELGCGDGDPMLELRRAGLDVEGLDSSVDMLARLRGRAEQHGIEVTVHHSTIQEMDLGKTYRSIYLAGPTFNLLTDDDTAVQAFERIRLHLDEDGAALIPLFVPDPVPAAEIGVPREHTDESGRILRVTTTATERDEEARLQITVLRYEVVDGDEVEVTERPFTLHWWDQSAFRDLAVDAGLRVEAVLSPDGSPAPQDAEQFAFWLRRS